MKNQVEATKSHIKGIDYLLSNEQVEQALHDSVQFSEKNIPTDKFDSDAFTIYAFGGKESARAYGEFLRESEIKAMSVHISDLQNKPFARQIWFGGLDHWSDLNSSMYISCRLRGVKLGVEGTIAEF